jgi:glutamyl endopeptidase
MFGASIVSILGAGQTAAQVLDPISNTGEEFPATIDASMLDTSPFIGGQGTGIAAVDEGAEEAGPVSDRVLDMLQALEGVVSPVEKAEQEEGLAEVILGFDVRTRDYTTAFPASAVVLIAFDGGACSGFMIGTDTVATAGHCVHPGNGGSFYDVNSYTIFPGFDASVAPFGSCGARRLHSVTQWTNGADERVDFGAIKLDCTIGNLTGWFGFRANAGNNEPAIVTGYPDDKDLQQWQSSDKVRRAETWQLFYPNDTRPGNSGGPIWQDWWNSANNSLGPYAIGIHAYGTHGAGAHALYNHGTRLVPAIFDLLARWKNAP